MDNKAFDPATPAEGELAPETLVELADQAAEQVARGEGTSGEELDRWLVELARRHGLTLADPATLDLSLYLDESEE